MEATSAAARQLSVSQAGALRRAWREVKIFRTAILMLCGLVVVGEVIAFASPYFAGQIVEAMAPKPDRPPIPFRWTGVLLVGMVGAVWLLQSVVWPSVIEWYEVKHLRYRVEGRMSFMCVDRLTRHRHYLETHLAQGTWEPSDLNIRALQASAAMAELVVFFARNIPSGLIGLVAMGVIVYLTPLFGAIVMTGGLASLCLILYINRVMGPRSVECQRLQNGWQAYQTSLFNAVGEILSGKRCRRASLRGHASLIKETVRYKTEAALTYNQLNRVRGGVIILTNLSVWVAGYLCVVETKSLPLGIFLMLAAWAARVVDLFSLIATVQRKCMDTLPAVQLFFSTLEELDLPAGVQAKEEKVSAPPVRRACPPLPTLTVGYMEMDAACAANGNRAFGRTGRITRAGR